MKAQLLDHMGSDLTVVNAARVSMSKESLCMKEEDESLISYLAKHNHWTPFAHTCIQMRMQAPVPIRTQCFKHKSGFVENEESRRYIDSKPEIFLPSEFRLRAESVKQGSGATHPHSDKWLRAYEQEAKMCVRIYLEMIDDKVCPEQARLILPQGTEVNWIWTGNVASFARFVKQRTASHAQLEVQYLAHECSRLIQPLFPISWSALTC